MADRTAELHRKTKETDVFLNMNLDGTGRYEIESGVGFLDHMLTHLSKHSGIDLTVKASGELEVDGHNTIEKIALCRGECLDKSLGDKKGIGRYGNNSLPMEETLAETAVDLSGRPAFVYNVKYRTDKIGDFDVECIEEMLRTFSNHGKFNLHINVPYGTNSHHIAEAVFKSLGKSLRQAVAVTGTDIPSTKGVL